MTDRKGTKWSARMSNALRRSHSILTIARSTSRTRIGTATQEALEPPPLAQSSSRSTSANPTEGISTAAAEEQTRYVLSPVLDNIAENSGAFTLPENTSASVDASSPRSTEGGVPRPRSVLASDTNGSLDQGATNEGQGIGIAEPNRTSTLVNTTDSPRFPSPNSDVISPIISIPQKLKVFRRSNPPRPRQGGFPSLLDTQMAGGRGADIATDSTNATVVQAGGNLQEVPLQTQQPLIVTDELLGTGSCGTHVYKGSFQGRPVAVKKLFREFTTLAEREIKALQTADAHLNVIRYYYQEIRGNCLYIALELCRASLADVIARPDREQWQDIVTNLDPRKALEEITSGLDHLHYMKIVHRDIKPQNILISGPLRSRDGKRSYRMMISDFGICKRLEGDQTSFLPTTGTSLAGTRGWLAPEVLSIILTRRSGDEILGHRKLKKSVDIFPLGCLFYYTLTKGQHPYGHDLERDVGILNDRKDLSALDGLGEDGRLAKDLITKMLDPEPSQRPRTLACLEHEYFTATSAPSVSRGSIATASSASPQHHAFQGHEHERPSHPISEPDVAQNPSASRTTGTPTRPSSDKRIPKPQSEPHKWSAVYHPELKRAREFHLSHLVIYGSRLFCAKISPNGNYLAVGLAYSGKTYISELKTGTRNCVLVDRYVEDRVSILSVQFSPDGQLLATGASDSEIRIWDIPQKRMRAKFKRHESSVNGIAFSPNGRSLVSGSLDHSVRMWSLRDGSSNILPVTNRASFFLSVTFSPNGRYIAGGNMDNLLWIWDSRTNKVVATWLGHTGSVWCTVFTPNGKGLMSGSKDQMIKHWDVSSLGTQRGPSRGPGEQGFPEIRRFTGHNSPVRSIAFFPGGQWIVTGSGDRIVRIWDLNSGVCQLRLQGHKNRVRGVDACGTHLVTASDDGRIALWRYNVIRK